MPFTPNTYERVYIQWIDSSSIDGWVFTEDFQPELQTVESVGFIVHENDEMITISSHRTPSAVHSPFTIPKFAIIQRCSVQ